MYRRIGENVSRYAIPWIVIWVVLTAVAISQAPRKEDVWQDGELAFLPENLPSRQAVRLYRAAFPAASAERFDSGKDDVGTSVQQDPLGSNIVIVLQREDRPSGLTSQDHKFITDVLVKKLEFIQRTTPRGYGWTAALERDMVRELPPEQRVIKSISTFADPRIGELLTSPDHKATLVILELNSEFLERQNSLVVGRIEHLMNSPEIKAAIPYGLGIALSGSATVGRDMLRAEIQSASRTEGFTKLLVIVLLLLIYRAPLLAVVPLVTVGVAVGLTQSLLRIMAGWGWIGLFTGLDVYVTVVVYGAGVDYCLFLIARYKEELDAGSTYREAMSHSIRLVGAALATSAGTSIFGIGMLGFSDFGKFRQAGFAISFGLAIVLCFALTFTPAFLLIFGKWLFWPKVRRDEVGEKSGWLPSTNVWTKLQEQRFLEQVWQRIADLIEQRPATIFLATILAMAPFAVVGVVFHDNLSYGLLTDLPQDEPSVEGAKVVQKHFPAGITGPDSLFIRFPEQVLHAKYGGKDLSDLSTSEQLSQEVTRNLKALLAGRAAQGLESIGIVEVRNQYFPLGDTPKAVESLNSLPVVKRVAKRRFAHRTYTSLSGDLKGQVLRMDFVRSDDPFSRGSIHKLSLLEDVVLASLPPDLALSAEIFPLGTTAGIRDLKTVTDHDRILIDLLVVASVYLMLVVLLRTPEICAYLIVTVVFSYLVTIGATFVLFYLRDPQGFNGIDWKIPVYLFTILIAMGEDYNILLMARVEEEQKSHGLTGGVLQALMKTGSIISSCGIIMAGTFLTLMAGTLLGMVQLGFALAFGVLLDTFVVRPILVPAYLVLLYRGRFGRLGRLLGAPPGVGSAESIKAELVA